MNHGVVQYAGRSVLEDATFEIKNREKIAVVGRNGSGKTTLLKLIAGEIPFEGAEGEEGFYATTGDPVIGYLKQTAFDDPSITMEEELKKELRSSEEKKEELDQLAKELETDYSEEKVAAYTRMEEEF